MRRFLVTCALMGAAHAAVAQNVQLHYDLGRNIYAGEEAGRPKVTATFEQLKADGLGSWFYFIDLDLRGKGMAGAYAEVSREFCLGRGCPLAAHVEYDGGLSSDGGVFQPAALAGVAWNGHSADFGSTCSVQLMYKRYFTGCGNGAFDSIQLTGVWGVGFAGGRYSFCGFIDLWRGEGANGHGMAVVLAEPQLWWSVGRHLSVGTEVEVSNNFVFNMADGDGKTFFANPTLGVKYAF